MLALQLPPHTTVIDTLAMSPSPHGGWFRGLPDETAGGGLAPHVVNYLLAVDSPIACFHRLPVDSMYYFHQGCPLVVLTISPDGLLARTLLGGDLDEGQQFQCAVAAGWWRAFELTDTPWALMSAAIASSGATADQEFATMALFQREVPHLRTEVERFVKA
jgi:predicted cupin superfamily sugar epimerase